MTIVTVRRLAADIFNVGQNKVRISPDGLKEAEGALTRADVKGLIEKGIITRAPHAGRASTTKRGRRGHGHRKGHPLSHKEVWMEKIRAQRKFLAMLVSTVFVLAHFALARTQSFADKRRRSAMHDKSAPSLKAAPSARR